MRWQRVCNGLPKSSNRSDTVERNVILGPMIGSSAPASSTPGPRVPLGAGTLFGAARSVHFLFSDALGSGK